MPMQRLPKSETNATDQRVFRVVFDSNILLRALLKTKGPSAQLLEYVFEGQIRLILSPYIIREVRKGFFIPSIRKNYPLSLNDISEYLGRLQCISIIVHGDLEIKFASRDLKDNPILACALEGHANFLVTDDRQHLLPLKHFHRVQIVSVPDFLKMMRRR